MINTAAKAVPFSAHPPLRWHQPAHSLATWPKQRQFTALFSCSCPRLCKDVCILSASGRVFGTYEDALEYVRKREEESNNKYVTVKRIKRGKNICCQWTQRAMHVGRPFVKRFALCYRTVVCPVSVCLSVCHVLSVCDVGVLWTDQDETLSCR